MKRETCFRITLVTVSTLATLAAVELFLRVRPPAVLRYRSYLEAQIPYHGPPLHPDPRRVNLAYVYEPGMTNFATFPDNPQGYFDRQNRIYYTLNPQGFRDAPFAKSREGAPLVAAVGDSFTLGQGVRAEDAWPAVLERLLGGTHPGAEVYNFGLSGYCTVDELSLLGRTVMDYRPDLVVWQYHLNDIAHDAIDAFNLKMYRLKKALPGSRWPIRTVTFVSELLWNRYLSAKTVELYRGLYASPRLWERQRDLLRAARRTAAAGEASFLMVIFPDVRAVRMADYPFRGIHEQLADFLRREGIPFLDLSESFRRAGKVTLEVHPVDPHPNAAAHRLAATAIREAIDRGRLLR